MRKVINALVSNDSGKILLFKKNLTWILPGGKPEEGESDIETLVREFKEEADGAEIEIGSFYKTYIGETPHSKDTIESIVYNSKLKNPEKKIIPSGEIDDARFFSYFYAFELNLSDITRKVMNDLIKERYT